MSALRDVIWVGKATKEFEANGPEKETVRVNKYTKTVEIKIVVTKVRRTNLVYELSCGHMHFFPIPKGKRARCILCGRPEDYTPEERIGFDRAGLETFGWKFEEGAQL